MTGLLKHYPVNTEAKHGLYSQVISLWMSINRESREQKTICYGQGVFKFIQSEQRVKGQIYSSHFCFLSHVNVS
jgi:hypothetical protein